MSKALIYDNIHGYIDVDPISRKIIDTPEFQRLRYIHQTGALFFVFPTANHSRFEHSVGTYHLAKSFITSLQTKQPELKISDKLILLVSLAGLCHDIGHLFYSHLFDDLFLEKLDYYKDLGKNVHHEERSKVLIKYIVNKYELELSDKEIVVVQDLIDPKNNKYDEWDDKFKVGKWVFQIVSNPINNIDVDKFDYIDRDNRAVGLKLNFEYWRLILQAKVINNNIHYPEQVKDDIYHMFFVRYRLHRQIYNHKTVKAIELLLIEALFELEKTDKISSYIKDPEKMIELTDMYLHYCKNDKVTEIINRIETRKIPKLLFQRITEEPFELTKEELGVYGKDIKVIKFKVGYTSGDDKNPLENIKFYKTKTNKESMIESSQNYSLLINHKHQEHFYRVYNTK
jgi:HD superfamily phosphohydrolase